MPTATRFPLHKMIGGMLPVPGRATYWQLTGGIERPMGQERRPQRLIFAAIKSFV